MIRYLRFAVLMLGLAQIVPIVRTTLAQTETGRPFLTNFSPNDYGAHPQSIGVIQDHRGVMYFGNRGVLEYDGVSWRIIPVPNEAVNALGLDSAGRVYVGSSGDFGYLAAGAMGQMQYASLLGRVPEADRAFDEVRGVHATPHGIYFRAPSHLFRYDPGPEAGEGSIQVWRPASPFRGSFLTGDRLYIQQADVGLMQMVGDSLHLASGGERFADEFIVFMAPYGDSSGQEKVEQMLVGTENQGFFLYDGVTFTPFPTEADAFLQANGLLRGMHMANGTFVLGTGSGGVAIIDRQGRFLQLIDQAAGLQNNSIRSVFADRQDALWLTLEYGITRVESASPFTQFNQDATGQPLIVYPDIRRHAGTLYVTSAQALYALQGQPPGLHAISGIKSQTWSLLSVGSALLVASSDGLYQVEGTRATLVKPSVNRSFSSQVIHRSLQDEKRVFVGLADGVAVLRRQGTHWIDEGRVPGIQLNTYSIIEPEVGTLWLGTRAQGIVRVQFEAGLPSLAPARIDYFDTQHGLPRGENTVYAISSHLLVATSEGLFGFDEATQHFLPDTMFAPIFSEGVREVEAVVEDRQGRIWIGSEEAGEMAVALSQRDGTYRVNRTPFLGLPRGTIYAVYPDEDGVIWFGGPDGLVRYDSNIDNTYRADFTALVRSVAIRTDSVIYAGAEVADGTGLRLAPADNALRFEFAAPHYDATTGTMFQTYLDGFDPSRSAWSMETRRDYTNLPPGDYTFRVRAKNVYEQESTEAAYTFTILPPWYRTGWAYALFVVLFGFLVFAVDRVQRKRVLTKERERTKLKEAELRAETAEANTKALQAENERKQHVELLSEMGRAVTSTLSIEEVIETVYENVNSLMDATVFGIGLYNEDEKRIDFPATKEKGETLPPFYNRLDDADRLAVWCFKNREEVISNDYGNEYSCYVKHLQNPVAGEHTESILYLPLVHQDKAIGVITAQSFEKNAYTEHHVNILRNLATYTAIALDNADAYRRLSATLENLRATQQQLLTQEKLASLGELTAGIAHEIKNPLNFVNNFAEMVGELAQELDEETASTHDVSGAENTPHFKEILTDLKTNAVQIAKHGKRADAIVQAMMQHASGGSGQREATEINQLVSEHIELAYHGKRAQIPGFTCEIERALGDEVGIVEVVPQEIGRVLLNLLSNAFDAVHEHMVTVNGAEGRTATRSYTPTVIVSTRWTGEKVEICIADNGPGIPKALREKIFEPFFTTKPTGSGTGLGLSLSYDIVTQGHGGTLVVESTEGDEGAVFVIRLPASQQAAP